jgi:hypothetical protein
MFLCFRKVTQEIFLELDETKAKHPKKLPKLPENQRGDGTEPGVASTPGGAS